VLRGSALVVHERRPSREARAHVTPKLWPPMTDRQIRAMLRGATAAKILNGWQGPHLLERSYCIAPCNAAASERPLADVISYCETLATAGVEPLFRASEPLM
jgi:hypothetical protein